MGTHQTPSELVISMVIRGVSFLFAARSRIWLAVFGAVVYGLIAWALVTLVGPISRWADGDRTLIVAEVAFFMGASLPALALFPYPGNGQSARQEREEFVRTGVWLGITWVAATGLLYSVRFREWWLSWPGWLKAVALFIYLYYGGWFMAASVATWLLPSLTLGLDDERASRRIQRLIGGIVAFAYGAGLYFWVGAVVRAGGEESGKFMREHLFDGFVCAAAVTLGFELASRLKPDFGLQPRWISFIAAYFALVSAAICGSATFVSGSNDAGQIADWSLIGAVVGAVVGAATATGYAQQKAEGLSLAMRRWAEDLPTSIGSVAITERSP